MTVYPTDVNASSSSKLIMTAEDWLKVDLTLKDCDVLVGSPNNPLVRPLTKNLVQAPEKAFKTTFLLRLTMGISAGETVFSSLPVSNKRSVFYLHGELSPAELKQRTAEAATGLDRPLENFVQGKCLDANLISVDGQRVIRRLIEQYRPEILVLDPYQAFIAGAEENSFKDVSRATRFMDNLIEDYELTIFLPIHLGKDHTRGARGHSTIAGWRDTLFTLKRHGGGLTVNVEPRWAKPPEPLKLTFRDGTLWEGNGPKWTKQAGEIRALLLANGGTLTRKEVAFGINLDPEDSAFRMALKRAQESDAILLDGDVVSLPPHFPRH